MIIVFIGIDFQLIKSAFYVVDLKYLQEEVVLGRDPKQYYGLLHLGNSCLLLNDEGTLDPSATTTRNL